jgi:cytochrome c oxidase subunit 3
VGHYRSSLDRRNGYSAFYYQLLYICGLARRYGLHRELTPPEWIWPTVNVVLLLLSGVSMLWAGRGNNRNNQSIFVAGTAISVLLACLVLVFRTLEFQALGFRWDSHPYGSIVWTMAGFPHVHVASAIVGTAVVTLLGWIGYFHKERQIGVIVDTIYWNFVALAWIPLYVVLVWVPRLL